LKKFGSLGIRVVNTGILWSPVQATSSKGTRPREFPKSQKFSLNLSRAIMANYWSKPESELQGIRRAKHQTDISDFQK
jgi:hypothetical protein